MSGFTMMTGGQFLTQDSLGNMRPVHESLRVGCGADFETYVRSEHGTVFHYSPYNPVLEEYDDFWRHRPLRILFQPNGVWISAKVLRWTEYNMGPADNVTKWTLEAQMEAPADENVQVGALVELHGLEAASQHNGKVVLVTKAPLENETRYQVQCGGNAGASMLLVKLANLKLYEGPLEFQVHRMNVQGGGTLQVSYKHKSLETGGQYLSFEWLEPISETWYIVPDGEDAEWRQPIDPQELGRLRDETYNSREQLLADWGQSQSTEVPEAYVNWLEQALNKILAASEKDGNSGFLEMRKLILALPFTVVFEEMREWREHLDEDELQVLFVAADELLRDTEWAVKCILQEFQFGACPPGYTLPEEIQELHLEQAAARYPWDAPLEMAHIIYSAEAHRRTGEAYEKHKEYRAAIQHYKKALECIEDTPDHLLQSLDKKGEIGKDLNNIGLASKYLGDFCAASKYYGGSIGLTRNVSLAVDNRATLQREMDEWTGTTGTVSPFRNQDSESEESYSAPQVCAACGRKASNRCTGCLLICYCGSEHQRKDWKRHKRLCRSQS